jgi:type I restriction enzyme S subunit
VLDLRQFKHVEIDYGDCQPYWLSTGDLLFQRGNTREYVGMAAIYEGPNDAFLFPDLMIRVRLMKSVYLKYVHLVLLSPMLRQYFSAEATGASSTMPKINQSLLLNAPVPLPPVAEQFRIMATVDQLTDLVEALVFHIDSNANQRANLVESVLWNLTNVRDAKLSLFCNKYFDNIGGHGNANENY